MAKSVRFKVGQQVKINAENTGVAPLYRTIAQMGFSNGDTVKLVDYDPEDETWFVQSIDKIEVRGWIKRKNLAPIEPQPQPNPFKVGDKVRFIKSKTKSSLYGDSALYYANTAGLKDGEVYTVREALISNGYDKRVDHMYHKAFIRVEGKSYQHPYDCFELVKDEPKKRMAVCVDMSDSTSEYTLGKVYEIWKETSEFYYLADNTGNREGGMFKWRFKEITEVENKPGFKQELEALVAKYK